MMRTRRSLLLIVLALAAILIAFAGWLRPAGDAVRIVTLPIVRPLTSWTQAFTARWRHPVADPARVQMLENRIAALAVDKARMIALEKENADLRAQAKFLKTSGYDSVGARVINHDVHDQHALLLIDRGLHDQIEVGQAVVAGGGVFVGRISQIKEGVATVMLVTDPQSRIAASIIGGKRLIGVIEGRGNGAAELEYIPSNESLARDQLIVTAGTDEQIPADLPVGIVNAVGGKPTDAFLTAAVEPVLHAEELTFVSVLRPSALNSKH